MDMFCVECLTKDPKWVSVNNGIYLCINCAAKHRGYGVQISFIRSLEFDNLSENEKFKLKLGGNRKFMEFVRLYKLDFLEHEDIYITKASQKYRNMLEVAANKSLPFHVSQAWLADLPVKQGYLFLLDCQIINERKKIN